MKKIKLRLLQALIIVLYILIKPFSVFFIKKYNKTWLISEMGNEARDNGFAFFEYLVNNHPEVDARYVISKKSPDYEKIKKIGKVVKYRSVKHYILYMTAEVLASSHIMGYAPEYRCFKKLHKKMHFFAGRGKNIFLQHGIIKDYLDGLTADVVDLDIFVCGAKPEYEYIKKEYGFKEGVVQYTGLARYDNLLKDNGETDNFILLMPTWRSNLFYVNTPEEFKETNYYKKIKEVLENKELQKTLKEKQLKLIFYPHQEIQQYLEAFKDLKLPKAIVLADQNKYKVPELLRKCKMLITDYSSVFFDVAYLQKPIIYYQYDYDDYRANHYKEGYFSYKNNGFGQIVSNSEECAKVIAAIIRNQFRNSKKYERRAEKFFIYHDNNNCDRIFEAIRSVLNEVDS